MRVNLSRLNCAILTMFLMVLQPLQAAEDMWESVFAYQKKMADYGNPEAQVRLGQMYEEGHGVAQDFAEARHWYEKAARQNYAPAREQLTKLEARRQRLADEEQQRKLEEEQRRAREEEAKKAAEERAREAEGEARRLEAERLAKEAERERLQKEAAARENEAQELEAARHRAEEAKQKMLSTPEPL